MKEFIEQTAQDYGLTYDQVRIAYEDSKCPLQFYVKLEELINKRIIQP